MVHHVLHKILDLTEFYRNTPDTKKPKDLGFKGYSGLYCTWLDSLVVRMGGLEPPLFPQIP